jgi:hypothetical protein
LEVQANKTLFSKPEEFAAAGNGYQRGGGAAYGPRRSTLTNAATAAQRHVSHASGESCSSMSEEAD